MERGGRMSLLHDKHNRWYCIFIAALVPLLFLIGLIVIDTQTAATKEMFLTYDRSEERRVGKECG